uniref:Prefoldin subunit 6 n=1 Tax=Fibrocapsa japonica TaxID=94617 RepID=A0A7S2Y415_9STRA|mmetsp:Transcript_683/g.1002  ORF Transcript_683/g.1002 Transcript_683/m.1002 type:complete len:134 (+) Transcript_683:83-484(+)|eukprot:CAMPEP_0113934782 /NCGR_PEP_ID=MMETSP1339-20121228/2056_1 /TAXON_ID=94617 /ORGANISM="Fibrocapsa japonica" /LENGTH=133 /DNA_ID=CAMNT_0000936713 /DNA_START=56 /DNA_END=457 /DNA_ORIENTATION=+ /assembly_acc=CAM_ASM_000762
MAEGKAEVEAEVEKYKALNAEIQELMEKRQKTYQQANENGMVKQELDLLDSTTPVYKMIGPVLMKQDLDEARDNVAKRLDLIQREMKRIEGTLEGKQKQQAELGEKIMKMQQAMQARAVEAAKKAYQEGVAAR